MYFKLLATSVLASLALGVHIGDQAAQREYPAERAQTDLAQIGTSAAG